MNILRGLFDWEDIVASAGEVWDQSMRNLFEYDAYAGKNKFPAIVLSTPVPYNTATAGLFTGVPKSEAPSSKADDEQSGKDGALNKIGIIAFRARILGPNSPHSFLPDPCTDEISADLPADSVFKLVAMHTLFMTTDDYSATTNALPKKGSVVLVELDKNQFGYNLELGRYISVINSPDQYFNEKTLLNNKCIDGSSLEFGGTLGGYGPPRTLVYNGAFGTNVVLPNGSPPGKIVEKINTTYSTTGVILLKDAAADFNNMAQAYFKETGNKLGITDGLRSYAGQVKAKQKWIALGKPGNAADPGTSNHGFGVAVDLAAPGILPIEFGSETFKWLSANAPRYGWIHPAWAREGGSKPEPWHWEWKNRNTVFSVAAKDTSQAS